MIFFYQHLLCYHFFRIYVHTKSTAKTDSRTLEHCYRTPHLNPNEEDKCTLTKFTILKLKGHKKSALTTRYTILYELKLNNVSNKKCIEKSTVDQFGDST